VSTIVIKKVRVLDPLSCTDRVTDVALKEGVMFGIGDHVVRSAGPQGGADIWIEGHGKLWVTPTFIDIHAHLRDPGQLHKETLETGLKAAAAGGFGAVCCMPNTVPPLDSPEQVATLKARAKKLGGVKLYPIAAITKGLKGEELTDMAALKKAGAVAFSDNGHCVMSASIMREALRRSKDLRTPIIQHAEDATLVAGGVVNEGEHSRTLGLPGRPRVAEDVIVARDLVLAEETDGFLHIAHVSSWRAVRLIQDARERGVDVTAEVTPHHLRLSEDYIKSHGALARVNPPLRAIEDIVAVREALKRGDIEAIATDHAPHTAEEKSRPIAEAPPGLLGFELVIPTLLPLVASGALPLDRVLRALTCGPARILNLPAPLLRDGGKANLCVIDPELTYTLTPENLYSKSANHPLVGEPLVGAAVMTIIDGEIAFRRAL